MTTAEPPAVHPHVQQLIDSAPPLAGLRLEEMTALLLQAHTTRSSSEAGPCPGPAIATTQPASSRPEVVEVPT